MKKNILTLSFLLVVIMLQASCYVQAAVGYQNNYPDPMRFEKAIELFEASDREIFPPEGAILCIGSSSMRGWHETIKDDLSPLTVIPRGFGGSNMNDLLYYADRVVLPYKPRAIVIYEGDNDIASGVSPKKIAETFSAFTTKVHDQLPKCRIYFLSIKPSISRWSMWPKMQEANRLIAGQCKKNARFTYVDIASGMLGSNGEPLKEIFKKDMLHMNRSGYVIWRDVVKPVLEKTELGFEQRIGKQIVVELPGAVMEKTKLLNNKVWLYLPDSYSEGKDIPLLVFLHGGGERGENINIVKWNGPPMLIDKGKDFPFMVLSPQCLKSEKYRTRWSADDLNVLCDYVLENYNVDKDRVYLTGLSMGGYGSWAWAIDSPERFAAVVPICGGGESEKAGRIADLPIWVFHGGKDKVIPIGRSEEMVAALKKAGSDVKFTIYPETGHNSWVEAYEDPELYKWLLDQKRADSTAAPTSEHSIEVRIFKNNNAEAMPYRIYKPANYDLSKKYPLVLGLHGGGGKGTDNRSRGVHAFKVLSSPDVQREYPAFILTPQCPKDDTWARESPKVLSYSILDTPITGSMTLALEILESVRDEFSIDPARIYVTGHSMGSAGTWDIIQRNPELFAAAIPTAGHGDPTLAKRIAHLPVWIFHGGNDRVVPTEGSRLMYKALKQAGSKVVKYTEYPDVGHGACVPAWEEEEIVDWLFKQRNSKVHAAPKAENAKPADGTAPEVVTLNIVSKLPLVDRSKFTVRGTIDYSVPQKLNDGIEVADARDFGDVTKIVELLNETEKKNQEFKIGKGPRIRKYVKGWTPKIEGCIDSVLIAKDGKLILEEYFADARIDKLHYQMSITKSITACCIGKAIELGKIKSENDLILDYLPEVDRSKVAKGVDTLTLKDLLTMNSGIRFNRAKKTQNITRQNHVELYLTNTEPIGKNKKFKYDGTNVDILCHILYNTTGMTLGEASKKYMFDPMGITDFKFEKSVCGLEKGPAGMGLTSRGMLKIGLMIANDGKFNGKETLTKDWAQRSTAVHSNQHQQSKYCYFWWSQDAEVNGKTYRVRSARGAGGQFIFMLPELDLVAVFTSYYAKNTPIQHFAELIIPAFGD